MKTVHGYAINDTSQMIEMFVGAEIISVCYQQGIPYIWAIVDDSHSLENRYFNIYQAGDPMPANFGTFISSFRSLNSPNVFHLFEAVN